MFYSGAHTCLQGNRVKPVRGVNHIITIFEANQQNLREHPTSLLPFRRLQLCSAKQFDFISALTTSKMTPFNLNDKSLGRQRTCDASFLCGFDFGAGNELQLSVSQIVSTSEQGCRLPELTLSSLHPRNQGRQMMVGK